jgi:hypothetical protein
VRVTLIATATARPSQNPNSLTKGFAAVAITSIDGRKVKIFESKTFSNRLRGVGSSVGSFIGIRPDLPKITALPYASFWTGKTGAGGGILPAHT